jgi:adenylate kinase
VPDHIINTIIEKRLRQSDCKVNGWVMEGFPYTKAQLNLLKAMKLKPSVAFFFDTTEEESLKRVGNRRVDPMTGMVYDLELNPPADQAIAARLTQMNADSAVVIKNKFTQFKRESVQLEDAFKE